MAPRCRGRPGRIPKTQVQTQAPAGCHAHFALAGERDHNPASQVRSPRLRERGDVPRALPCGHAGLRPPASGPSHLRPLGVPPWCGDATPWVSPDAPLLQEAASDSLGPLGVGFSFVAIAHDRRPRTTPVRWRGTSTGQKPGGSAGPLRSGLTKHIRGSGRPRSALQAPGPPCPAHGVAGGTQSSARGATSILGPATSGQVLALRPFRASLPGRPSAFFRCVRVAGLTRNTICVTLSPRASPQLRGTPSLIRGNLFISR